MLRKLLTTTAAFTLITSTALLATAQQEVTITIQPAQPTTPKFIIHPKPDLAPKTIDLALCLDTSGSMRGLLDAARMKLWDIVNDLSTAKPLPDLRVALLTFGNDGHNSENGWVKIDQPFTRDLDRVSEQLFALSTNGGTELVGRVLYKSLHELEWSDDDNAVKIMVVAGNESADQDTQTKYPDVCRESLTYGVVINSIYCGNPYDAIAPGWKNVADIANGHYAAIDQNEGTIIITTPYDSELAKLSLDINVTYIPYGSDGQRGSRNQMAQDSNSASMNENAVASRAQSKGSALYNNYTWDLVDACNETSFKLAEVPTKDLPTNMQSMTITERHTYIKSMETKRKTIQTRIKQIGVERTKYLATETAKQSDGSAKSFDLELRNAIRTQAEARGFTFKVVETTVAVEKKDDH